MSAITLISSHWQRTVDFSLCFAFFHQQESIISLLQPERKAQRLEEKKATEVVHKVWSNFLLLFLLLIFLGSRIRNIYL